MFPTFIGINEKFLNLNAVALIEDKSTESEQIATVTTIEGSEFDLIGDDAELLFDRAELIAFGSDAIFSDLQARADAADAANGNAASEDGE